MEVTPGQLVLVLLLLDAIRLELRRILERVKVHLQHRHAAAIAEHRRRPRRRNNKLSLLGKVGVRRRVLVYPRQTQTQRRRYPVRYAEEALGF